MPSLLYIHSYVFVTVGFSKTLFYDTMYHKHYFFDNGEVKEELLSLSQNYYILLDNNKLKGLCTFIIENSLGGRVPCESSPFFSKPSVRIKHPSYLSSEEKTNPAYYYALSYLRIIEIDCRGAKNGSIFSFKNTDEYYDTIAKWSRSLILFSKLDSVIVKCDSYTSQILLKVLINDIPRKVNLSFEVYDAMAIDPLVDLSDGHSASFSFIIDSLCNSRPFQSNQYRYITYVNDKASFIHANELKERFNDKLTVLPGDNLDRYTKQLCSFELSDLMNINHSMHDLQLRKRINTYYWGKILIDYRGRYVSPAAQDGYPCISDTSLLDYIKFELDKQGLWFFTRDNVIPCKDCSLRYICPSISTIELNNRCFNMCKIELR